MANKRVLIIDDDTWFAESMARRLKGAGFTVHAARDTLAGLACIDEEKPHLVVLDMFMPGPNGIVLLHELQSHTDLAALPVVVCTNAAASLDEATLRPYGVRKLLDKTTMEPEDVVAAARRYA